MTLREKRINELRQKQIKRGDPKKLPSRELAKAMFDACEESLHRADEAHEKGTAKPVY